MSPLTKAAAWGGFIIALLVGAVMVFGGASAGSPSFGTTNNTAHQEVIPWGFTNGIQIGAPSAVPVMKMIGVGTCNPTIASLPLGATTTVTASCTLPANYNLLTTDLVQASLPANPSSFGSFVLSAAYVSTAGQSPVIKFVYENLTGAATSSFPLATTSVPFEVFRNF
ncbi:MAG: hypothetical protein KGI03_00940 [Patescibacteria group bacterium]|nr:hypothetical protein [Patescibacteria group bacterium]